MTSAQSPKDLPKDMTTSSPTIPIDNPPQVENKVYPIILVVGVSGSGKSCSLRNLNKETTKIYNIERKALPFREAALFKRQYWFDSQLNTFNELKKDLVDPTIETIVFDSFTSFSFELEEFAKLTKEGWDIWSLHNNKLAVFFNLIKPAKKNIIVTAIPESLKVMAANGSERTERRVMVQGRKFEGKIEEQFTIVLATSIEVVGDKVSYKFITNSDGVVPAKSPMGMFPARIDNDCAAVIKTAREYWGNV